MLYAAAFLIFATGLAHSVLGERYILVRLFKGQDLPKLFGDTSFTVGTLRFVGHLTTVAWWGFAYMLVLAKQDQLSGHSGLQVVCAVAVISGFFPLFFTRGKHLSWIALKVVLIARNRLASLAGLEAPTASEIMTPEMKSHYAVG